MSDNPISLYPFQAQSKNELREALRRGLRRIVLCSPTGSGKTEIAMSIVADVARKGGRCTFVVDRQTLVRQTSDRFNRAGIRHGMLMGADTHTTWSKVIVACSPTLENRGWAGPPPDLTIIDECHDIRKQIVEKVRAENLRVIGLSATPLTRGLGEWYERIVNVTTTRNLIAEGYLAPLKIVGPKEVIDTSGLAVTGGEWKKDDLTKRVLRIVGDIVPTWVEQTSRHFGGVVQTIVFCPSVAESQQTADAFKAAGYDFRVIYYKQSADEKHRIIERFRRGEHIGLISCVALTKGFDVPGTRCLIDAYPLRASLAMHIQKLGRVMRRSEGKEYGLVIDHAENYLRFEAEANEFFSQGCNAFVEKVKGKRKGIREIPLDRQCLKCRIILEPTEYKCPLCGTLRPTNRSKSIERVSGPMGVVAELIGQGNLPEGELDWWVEICAAVCETHPADTTRARKKAYAVYKATFSEWPSGRFRVINRAPHPAAKRLVSASFNQWKRGNRKKT